MQNVCENTMYVILPSLINPKIANDKHSSLFCRTDINQK